MDKKSGLNEAVGAPVPSPASRLRVLTFMPRFSLQHRVVGPVRSLINIAERLGPACALRIVTLGNPAANASPEAGKFGQSQRAAECIHYVHPSQVRLWRLPATLRAVPHDVIYLNSAFGPMTLKVLLLRRLGCLGSQRPVIVATRGEFRPAALATKALKKASYLFLAKRLGLYRQVLWQATSQTEQADIFRVMGPAARVKIAGNLIQPTPLPATPANHLSKAPNQLKCVFLSRIAANKNLLYVLERLRDLPGQVELGIYGHVDDLAYWQRCQSVIRSLPANITVTYHGVLPADQVLAAFGQYHLFIVPTLWENFGHVIMESLMAGCPVLISDQTPWRHLAAQGVGWDCPLAEPEAFHQVLRQCLAMPADEFQAWSRRAHAFAMAYATDPKVPADHLALFQYAASLAETPRA